MKNQLTFLLFFASFFIFEKQTTAQIPNLTITEIMYNPPETGTDSMEYIEIYNNEITSIDLEGYFFSEGITHEFSDVTIAPQQFIILAKDSLAFKNVFGIAAMEWQSGTLSNNGEQLQLSNPQGGIIDEVTYQNNSPWPIEANGLGASLVLCDFSSDNDVAENWQGATSPTNIFINNSEIIANPNSDSNCPPGPIIGFNETSINLVEQTITLNLLIVLENGNSNLTEIELAIQNNSTATLNEDFNFDFSLPHIITFSGGIENDTQIVSIHLQDDLLIESNETIFLSLSNPSNGAIVDPMHDELIITIEDNDATLPDIVISEIMYNPPETGSDSTEFLEILNNDTLAVNLVNYSFSAGINFTFPEIILNPDEYIVVSRDSSAFQNYYGFPALEWTSGSLTNSGELIELRNPGGNIADFVEYSNTASWSDLANGLGSSLVLCDPNLDNNTSTNWSSSLNPAGIMVEGYNLLASPLAVNNCFIPLSPFQPRSIETMTSVNNDGVLDSLNQLCELQGIVYGVNLNASNDGLQFVLIDENEDGIMVYSNTSNFDYTVQEGDELIVHGTITQFNGLAEIIPDTLFFISNNNTLTNPQLISSLGEFTESQLIKIENLTILNPSQWNNSDPAGFSVDLSNGIDTFEMRIDSDVDLYNMSVPDFRFNLTGLGSQYDSSSPFLEGYQILPRYSEDIEMVTLLKNLQKENEGKVYPNPASDFLFYNIGNGKFDLKVYNTLGQLIFVKNKIGGEGSVDLTHWKSGIYVFKFITKNEINSIQILKK